MATFTNRATLTYSGGTADSNLVTGELVEILSAEKSALGTGYGPGDRITYLVSLRNTGTTALTGIQVADDLGSYLYNGATLTPLTYVTGSANYYVGGVRQTVPTVTPTAAGVTFTGLNVPAGGDALLVYQADVNGFAPLGADGSILNTATVTGAGISTPVVAAFTLDTVSGPDLSIRKALSPAVVQENGQLTYTFTVENFGDTAATATDNVAITDTFDPVLNPITVTYNGAPWAVGANYTYNAATGAFATVPGQILVPAATFTQNADGSFTVTPGTATVTVTGTV